MWTTASAGRPGWVSRRMRQLGPVLLLAVVMTHGYNVVLAQMMECLWGRITRGRESSVFFFFLAAALT